MGPPSLPPLDLWGSREPPPRVGGGDLGPPIVSIGLLRPPPKKKASSYGLQWGGGGLGPPSVPPLDL